jgi:catechol 2,3-dioxygenase-like lactoylglutathione lyase family enzyme
MPLRHISLVSVPVAHQDRAKHFYADLLAFEVVLEAQFGEGMHWVQLSPPGGGASIALVTWFDRMPPGWRQGLVLETDDVHGDYDRLRQRGLEFRQDIEDAPWGTFTTFDDPDGNGWVLQQTGGGT